MTMSSVELSRPHTLSSQDWEFITRDQVHLTCSRWVRGHRVVVFVVPGMLMTRACDEHRVLAEALSPFADVYTLDSRGHGASGGRFSFGLREPGDVAEICADLRQRYQTVIGLGFSMGGYHIAAAAAEQCELDAVITAGTPTGLRLFSRGNVARAIARTIPMAIRRRHGWHRLSISALYQRSPALLTFIHRVAPIPLLITHGGDDWLVASHHARQIYECAREPKQLRIVPGARHAESLITEQSGVFLEQICAFITQSTRKLSRIH